VELGPGLLTTIFDGIQRPLKAIALSSGDCFIPRGVDVPALDRKKQWEFNPGKVKVCYQLMDEFKCPKSAYQSADMHSISRLIVVWHKAVLSIGLMQQQ